MGGEGNGKLSAGECGQTVVMKILYVLPLNYSLGSDLFRSRYRNMPDDYQFHILVTGDLAYDGEEFANTKLHAQPWPEQWARWQKIKRILAMAVRCVYLARRVKIDVIICYDPLTLGLIGALAKIFSRAKLVIEINGHLRDAAAASQAGRKPGWLKRKLFNTVGTVTLFAADCVKLLNEVQYAEWRHILSKRPTVVFHDYVPTSQFIVEGRDDHFIYCLGYPFYTKCVDVLIDAFALIGPEFPDFRLMVMGHCSESELEQWKACAARIRNVEFRKPVPYSEVGKYFTSCSVFATPSRSEGMGRVFIEAMASGKPCVGTRVGGIPYLIVDGQTGFLVDSEDAEALADRLRTLLADPDLRVRMGKAGRRRVEDVVSERRYVEYFRRMIDGVLGDKEGGGGIRFNGYKEPVREEGRRG